MIERIRQLISEQALTSAAFADKLGVPRSTISHILSGRNRPSLEMVHKILDAFPELRTEWLVRGEGLMYAGQATAPEQGDLFSQYRQQDKKGDDQSKDNASTRQASPQVSAEEHVHGNEPAPDSVASNVQNEDFTAKQSGSVSAKETAPGPGLHNKTQESAKPIEKIIILHQDGTFVEYIPANS